ncbi:MAG: hypothetical protein ACM4AI_10085 [Acidobacteriota bacterium]
MLYSFRLIRHFERADRVRLYREIARVLAPRARGAMELLDLAERHFDLSSFRASYARLHGAGAGVLWKTNPSHA